MSVKDTVKMDPTDILFAPHHGRNSGKVPKDWLKDMNPKIVIIGEAPSDELNYYDGYNTITQNPAGHITFQNATGKHTSMYPKIAMLLTS